MTFLLDYLDVFLQYFIVFITAHNIFQAPVLCNSRRQLQGHKGAKETAQHDSTWWRGAHSKASKCVAM